MTTPRAVHMVPVFALTDEPGWIILTRKKKAKIAQFFTKLNAGLDEDAASWEPDVKSWFVRHDKIAEAMEQMALASAPESVVYCQGCSVGQPCEEWAGVKDGGFLCRGPEQTQRAPSGSEQNGPFGDPVSNPTTDPDSPEYISPTAQFWFAFWKEFSGPRKKWQQGDTATTPGMSEQEAAGLLSVPWPCSQEQLTASYRTAAMKAHPDHGGSTEQMAKINIARDVLMKQFQQGAAR